MLATVRLAARFSFNFNVLLPLLARETLGAGADVFGAIGASFGAGALVGALLTASLGRASPRALVVGVAAFGLAQLLLAPQESVTAAAILLFAAGVSFTLWTANANAILQLGAPDHLRGRVLGLYFFAFHGSMPLGGLLAGWLAAAGGTPLAFAVAGVVALAAALAATVLLAGGGIPRVLPRRAATIEARG